MKRLLTICLALAITLTALPATAAIHELPIDQTGGYPVSADNLLPDTGGYKDESIDVQIEYLTYRRTKCFIVRVKLANPTQLRTAMTYDRAERHDYVKASIIAKQKNSVVCVNGDFFKYNDYGYLVRQGVLYRDAANGEHDILLIDEKGDFHVAMQADADGIHKAVSDLNAEGHTVVNSLTFGPLLVQDGVAQSVTTTMYQAGKKMMRVAIAQLGELEYAIFYCDGNVNGSNGLTMQNFANFIADSEPRAKIAYNLDGGGSAHVVVLQHQIHKNSSGREICDIIYFASASDLLGERED